MLRILASTALTATVMAGAAGAQSMIETEGASMTENSVSFPNVRAEEDGYLVVTERLPDGTPSSDPESVSYTPVAEGDNEDVTVEGSFEPGIQYMAVVFSETNDQDDFQWGENIDLSDEPSLNDGMPVVTNFQMIRQSG